MATQESRYGKGIQRPQTSQVAQSVKNPPAGGAGDMGLIPSLGRSPGGGHGKPLQYSCPENPMDRGAWWATPQGLKELDMTEATEYAQQNAHYRVYQDHFLEVL